MEIYFVVESFFYMNRKLNTDFIYIMIDFRQLVEITIMTSWKHDCVENDNFNVNECYLLLFGITWVKSIAYCPWFVNNFKNIYVKKKINDIMNVHRHHRKLFK